MRYTTLPRTATFAWSPASFPNPPASSSSSPTTKQDEFLKDSSFASLMVTGTASGALDSSFSSDSKLEIWSPFDGDAPAPKASVAVTSRFNRVVWGDAAGLKPKGLIAAGMENAELHIWDPVKILAGQSSEACLMSKMTSHTGPVKGLDFNPIKSNLLASGASKAEVFIWDLNNPVKPFAPPPSRSLDDVTSVSWNHIVQSVLAVSSNNGYTVVWDIREANGQKGREVATLSYSGSVNPMPGYGQTQPSMMGGPQYGNQWIPPPGGRPGSVSSVAWHPENPTKLVTASEDDGTPIVLVWDLRNARAPEKILAGHEKGILSLAWCKEDVDLLLSCGKDCRTICWSPTHGEIVAELPPSSNWSFQTSWCPQNPNLVATASFDGRIAISSLQSTNENPDDSQSQISAAPSVDGSDIFGDQGILALNSAKAAVSLKQAPKWHKRPASAVFAFGGKLVVASNQLPSATPAADHQLVRIIPSVAIKHVVTESTLVDRALKLENASQARNLQSLCEERLNNLPARSSVTEKQSWKLLTTLFKADSRENLIALLGFSKQEVKALVDRQIEAYKATKRPSAPSRGVSEAGPMVTIMDNNNSDNGSIPREPLVTFADTPTEGLSAFSEGGGDAAMTGSTDAALSESSTSAISEGTKIAEAESEITEPSLFGDDNANPTAQTAASLDFYNSMRSGRPATLPDHVLNRVSGAASSVGATVGSSASSVASEAIKVNTFQIYPQDESKGDRLITKALVVGDFDSAVSLCISTERYADAILLGIKGGPELLEKAQKAYFESQTLNLPYLRLYQSIVLDDLADVVQNADLAEWQEIFVVVCTFAKKDEFSSLLEQLGQRLEYLYTSSTPTHSSDSPASASEEHRKNAILCYLAAGKLEKVVGIWIEQMREEEEALVKNSEVDHTKSRSSLHAEVLQTFIEKVTVFQNAINYIDLDLAQPTDLPEAAARGVGTYKLANLYDCYCEYAELLASQGLANTALRFISQTPLDYATLSQALSKQTRERLSKSIGLTSMTSNNHFPPEQKTPTSTTALPPLNKPFAHVQAPSTQSSYKNPYNPPNIQQNYTNPNYNTQSNMAGPPLNNTGSTYTNPYESPYNQAPNNSYASMATGSFLPPPPMPLGTSPAPPRSSSASQPPPVPASRQPIGEVGGWNDAPVVNAIRKTTMSAMGHKQVLTSPFPGGPASMSAVQNHAHAGPFGGSVDQPMAPHQASPGLMQTLRQNIPGQASSVPPPPKAGQRPPAGVPQTPQQYIQPNNFGPQRMPSISGSYAPPQQLNPQAFNPSAVPGPYGVPQGMPMGVGVPPTSQAGYSVPNQTSQYAPHPGMQHTSQQPLFASANQQQSSISGSSAYGLPGQPPNPAVKTGGFAPPPGGGAPPVNPSPASKPELLKAKYPPGDRSHIPEASKPIYTALYRLITQMKQGMPSNQKKLVDDTERRLNVLFDALNCETVPATVIEELLDIVKAIEARNLQHALQLHLSLLTSGVKSDELTTYMPAIKMLITKLH